MSGLFKKDFDIEAIVAGSFENSQKSNKVHQRTWHSEEEERWNAGLAEKKVAFAFANGVIASSPGNLARMVPGRRYLAQAPDTASTHSPDARP